MIDNMNIYGHTKVWKNGVLEVDQHNAILNDMRNYLRNRMETNTGYKGFTELLFNQPTQVSGGSEGANERGIVISSQAILGDQGLNNAQYAAGCVLTQTTNISNQASNNNAVKLKGTFTANAAGSYDVAEIVADWNELDYSQTLLFASNSFQTITLASGDVLTVEWEIYIQ